jgi:ribosomal protein S14
VEIYGPVRRTVRVEGRSQRAVAREFGLSRETVRKMLQYAVPPGYQRQQQIKRPKLGQWVGVISRAARGLAVAHVLQGLPQDDTQAAYWERKAAEQGHAYSQANLSFRSTQPP